MDENTRANSDITRLYKILYQNPNAINNWIRLGDSYASNNNYDSATSYYYAALELCDTQNCAREYKDLLRGKFEHSYTKSRGISEAISAGFKLHNEQRPNDLLKLVGGALEENPKSPQLNELMGMAYSQLSDNDEISDEEWFGYIAKAVKHFEVSFNQDPVEPATALFLAYALLQAERDREATNMFAIAKELMKMDETVGMSHDPQKNLLKMYQFTSDFFEEARDYGYQ